MTPTTNSVEPTTSATERLRALLDERGVEWWQSVNMLGCVFTRWYSPLFSDEMVAMENGDGELELFSHLMTPEQAIAATLGSGTCHDEGDPSDFCCSECGMRMFTETNDTYTMIAADERTIIKSPNYCPNCGREVVTDG